MRIPRSTGGGAEGGLEAPVWGLSPSTYSPWAGPEGSCSSSCREPVAWGEALRGRRVPVPPPFRVVKKKARPRSKATFLGL